MTIFGKHTVAETRDLIRATEFRTHQILAQYEQVKARRKGSLTSAQNQLDRDIVTFMKRWVDVRDKQTILMTAAVVSNPNVFPEILPAETNYVAVDNAIRRDDPRLVNIQQRLDTEAATVGVPEVDLSATPGQNSPDADFAALKKLDEEIAKGEKAAADAAAAAKKAAKTNTGMLIIGGAVVALAGVVAVKVYL